mmetsp:Transcript_21363/g.25955  ORF Transcript_21363/g.25955 Transcript_21363/m.25955 type:complete len:293 (+) Transcript_21363:1-879(+)
MEVDYFQYIYSAPWTRCTPYMVGVLLVLFMHSAELSLTYIPSFRSLNGDDSGISNSRIKSVKPIVGGACFIVALAVMLGLVLIHANEWVCKDSESNCESWSGMFVYGFFALQNWNQFDAVMYLTFGWLVWSLALAYVSYCLFTGIDPFKVHWFLSHRTFTPLARLTYNAYLVHLPLMIYQHGSSPYLPVFDSLGILGEVIYFIVLAYFFGFILYMIVEKPFMNIIAAGFTILQKRRNNDSLIQQYQQLERSMSVVSDIDSETIHLSSPIHESNAIGSIQGGNEGDYHQLDSS